MVVPATMLGPAERLVNHPPTAGFGGTSGLRHLVATKALTSIFSVELPGIEPGAETALTCEDDGIEYAKRRQKT